MQHCLGRFYGFLIVLAQSPAKIQPSVAAFYLPASPLRNKALSGFWLLSYVHQPIISFAHIFCKSSLVAVITSNQCHSISRRMTNRPSLQLGIESVSQCFSCFIVRYISRRYTKDDGITKRINGDLSFASVNAFVPRSTSASIPVSRLTKEVFLIL